MAYAEITDIPLYGLPTTALGQLTTDQKNACLEAASAEMDSYFRTRYSLPFISYGVDITAKCVEIAQYKMLRIRGFNPQSGADINIKTQYDEAIQWLVAVKEQKLSPNVTYDDTQMFDQPIVGCQLPRGFNPANSQRS